MSPIGTVHLVFSLLALVLGAVVLRIPKGTRWHRTWGHGYVWCMIGVIGTSFAMYRLTGRPGPFHLAAVVGGVTVAGGLWTALGRRPPKHWILAHATWMAWSYVGLCAAFVAESMTRFVMPLIAPSLQANALWPLFWTLVAVGSFSVFGVGAWLIRKRLPGAVAGTPAAMRRDRELLRAAEAKVGTRSG
ncbi:MAG: DUF2306 domain-containing protein [Gemmatimonadota bacterium]